MRMRWLLRSPNRSHVDDCCPVTALESDETRIRKLNASWFMPDGCFGRSDRSKHASGVILKARERRRDFEGSIVEERDLPIGVRRATQPFQHGWDTRLQDALQFACCGSVRSRSDIEQVQNVF
jgi:hypothetical protein